MKLDLGMHIGLRLVSFGKSGVTRRQAKKKINKREKQQQGYSRARRSPKSFAPATILADAYSPNKELGLLMSGSVISSSQEGA
jgi:hypothetical protein